MSSLEGDIKRLESAIEDGIKANPERGVSIMQNIANQGVNALNKDDYERAIICLLVVRHIKDRLRS